MRPETYEEVVAERNALRARMASVSKPFHEVKEALYWMTSDTPREEIRKTWLIAEKALREDRWAALPWVFGQLFRDAGIVATLTPIPNEYWPVSYLEAQEPWFLAATDLGTFKIGWRKSVISISWHDWENGPDGRNVFVREQDGDYEGRTTVYKEGVHAWSYKKAAEYLKRLREACSPPADAPTTPYAMTPPRHGWDERGWHPDDERHG